MRLLLDTAALLWWLDSDAKLGATARATLAEPGNEIFVSAASAWEISVKQAAGKLTAPFELECALARNYFIELPIAVAHSVRAGALPMHHKDPFDRMLVAQAQLESLTLVTNDRELAKYDVELLAAAV